MFCVNLRGKRYRFLTKRLPPKEGGTCDAPTKPGKAVVICKTIRSPHVLLENLIHEALHGCLWDLDEAAVTETAECITRVLIKAGVTLNVDEVHQRLKLESK